MFWIDKMIIPKIAFKTVGFIQATIGGLSFFLALSSLMIFSNLQIILGLSTEEIGLYLLNLTTFGILSTISGLLLFYEK